MNTKAFPVSLLLILHLAGCTLTPAFEKPQPPVSASFPRSGPAEPDSGSAASIEWQSFFGDERLKRLISTALGNNRDLLLAIRRVEEARALHGIRQADRFPEIDGSISGSRSRIPADLSLTQRDVISSQYQAALGTSAWELDFWGRLRSLETAALESYLATEEARSAVQASVIKQVASSYLLAHEFNERIDLAERTLKTRQEAARIAQRRFEVGSAARLDAIQAEILLNQSRAELTVLNRLAEQNHNALEVLVAAPVPGEHRSLSSIEAGFVPNIAVGLPSGLLVQRPDIRAAERRLKAANANIGAARAAFFPRIALTGSLGLASSDLDRLFSGGQGAWSFLPSITLPLFDGGRNRANLDLAHARRNMAIADYERNVQIAFREVADALADRHWLAEQIEAQRASLDSQRERSRIAGLRYQYGAATYLEVLDAERDLFAGEQALVQTRSAYLASSINLYTALGGGGDIPGEAGTMKGWDR
ncbi:Toluene efflux pump outer membrane protein TtgI [Methylophilaceae bacterium]|nr:Toluene efflux pump outer membrane protein TtgI [Methylophilaceae bacterium]